MLLKALVKRISSLPQIRGELIDEVSADDFYSRVQVHGLGDIGKARRRAGRLFWAVVTFFMIMLLVANVTIAVVEFVENPLYTSTTVTVKDHFPLPRVTVCPYNFFKYESFISDFPNDWRERLEHITAVVDGADVLDTLEAHQEWRLPRDEPLRRNYTIREFSSLMKKYSYGVNETIFTCMFQGRPFDCSKYTRKRIADGGKLCYEVDGLPDQKPRREPLLVFVKVNDTSDSNFRPLPLTGATVLLNFHRPTIPSHKIYVRAGERSKITIRVSGLNLVNNKDDPCLPPNQAKSYSFKIMAANTYDEERCSRECFQNISYDRCKCIQMNDVVEIQPTYQNATTCTLPSIRRCIPNDERETFVESLSSCRDMCRRPCFRRVMEIREDAIGFARAGNPAYETKLGLIDPAVSQSYIVLEVNYRDLTITNLTQRYRLTFNMFISNVGGLMGLWIGASVLSVFQLVIFGTKIVCHRVKRHQGRINAENDVENGAAGVDKS